MVSLMFCWNVNRSDIIPVFVVHVYPGQSDMRKLLNTCLIASLIALVWATSFAQKPVTDLKPTIILISLDGFRYDYLDKYQPPVLNKLAKDGVRAKWMIPSFPTKTF